MDRRWIGAAVVVAVLVGGLVTARLSGPGLAGTPVAEPPPAPPVVGDCLLSRDALPFWFVESPDTVVPASRVEPCTGDRFGEVVAVLPSPHPGTSPPVGTEPERPLQEDCDAAATDLLGPPGRPVAGPLRWTAASLHLILASGPDERRRAGGQDWIVCLIALGWDVMDTTTPDEQVSYARSLRGAYGEPELRDRLGYCTTGPDQDAQVIECGSPHRTQHLGWTTAEGALSRSDAEQSCADWLAAVVGLTDPTAGGALTTAVATYDAGGSFSTLDRIEPGSLLDCMVSTTGEQRLAGSLLGLAGAPIPWS